MDRVRLKHVRRVRRKASARKRIMGVPDRPRLTVFRSLSHIYAQVIDDLAGRTLVAASTRGKSDRMDSGGNCRSAEAVGRRLAEQATKAGVRAVVFDRSGYRYHGRVKALAEAARKGGLEF
ncbi:MAG: 50S ribosomal protein L18 [Planctomycetota bacterium]|jgi:large subunit ribosomal protein L18